MDYCRTCNQTEKDTSFDFWQRFKTDIEAMPSISVVRIELSLQGKNYIASRELLAWNQGSVNADVGPSVSIKEFQDMIQQNKPAEVAIIYHLNAPNRDRVYVYDILSLVLELLSDVYVLKENSVFHVAGQNRFGHYWTEIKILPNNEIQHSGVRPSPLSRFATLEPIRHTTTGW